LSVSAKGSTPTGLAELTGLSLESLSIVLELIQVLRFGLRVALLVVRDWQASASVA
jgi:hypothetical protein